MIYQPQAKDIVASTIGRQNENPQCCSTGGFYFIFGAGELNLRLATAYYSSSSSHLQMQQATTLAKMERIKDIVVSYTRVTPFLYLYRGWQLYEYSIEVENSQILSKIYYLMDIMSRIPAGTEKDPAFPIKDPASLSPWFSLIIVILHKKDSALQI